VEISTWAKGVTQGGNAEIGVNKVDMQQEGGSKHARR